MNTRSDPLAMSNDDERSTAASSSSSSSSSSSPPSSPNITSPSARTPSSTDNAAHDKATGAVQVQVVSNPYALKKSGPQLSMKPLHEPTTTAETTTAAVLEAPAITTADALPLSPNGIISEKQAIATDSLVANNVVSTSGGSNVPMWQRLPSRNLSFQSAEILTVSECCLSTNTHLSAFVDRSVRVTGCILDRLVHSNVNTHNTHSDSDSCTTGDSRNMVSLVLSDPLAVLPPSRNAVGLGRRSNSLGGNSTSNVIATKTTANNNNNNRRVSFPKTPVALHKIQQTGSSGNTLGKQQRTPGIHTRTILRRKSGGLLGGGGATPGSATTVTSSRKRNLSGAFNPTTPEDVLVQTLASSSSSSSSSTHNCLWVLVNPQHVSVTHSTTGDLVMAMGEIREYKPQDTDLPSTIHKIAARIRAAQRQQQQQQQQPQPQPGRKTVPGQEEQSVKQQEEDHKQNYRPIYFLQTRILRNANGTNMKLHTEALYARRQQLVAARSRQPAEDQDASAPCCVWPGCGPPPYNSNDSK